jgi:hypothetical protein
MSYTFKGTVSRDVLLQVFFMNLLPQAPENLQRYFQAKMHLGCHLDWWQILGTISEFLGLKDSLKKNVSPVYVNSTIQSNYLKLF